MVVLHPSSRNAIAPWPHSAKLGDLWVQLGVADKNGTVLVGEIPQNQGSVAPVAFGEQADNPIFGGVVSIRDLSRGMGQGRLLGDGNGRYSHCLNARTRSGYAIKGPGLTSYTPGTVDATVGVTRFFKLNTRWYALCGRYCLTGGTDGTGWTVSKDFGVGKAATDVIVLQTNQSGSTRYALVAMGDSENVWYFDGATASTTWTQTTGANAFKARAWAADTTTIYWANDSNKLNTCSIDSDVLTVANHASATQRIGGYDMPVTRLRITGSGSLLAAKQDDIHSLQSDGSWSQLFGERQFVPSTTNGEVFFRWGNHSYTVYGNQFFQLTDDGGLTPFGPELLRDNNSPVTGYITAGCGTDFFALCAIYDPDTLVSHLMEFTGEVTQDERGRSIPIWHGSIIPTQSAKKITSVAVDTAGAPTGHKMAYLGFSDGTITKYILSCRQDPADCDSEVFSTSNGEVYHSRIQFFFPGQRKAVLSATGEADNFGGANYAQLSYRITGTGAFTALGTDFTAGDRQRVTFNDAFSCTNLDTKVSLVSSSSASSPRITGFSFEWQLRTPPKEVMSVSVLAEDGLRMRDGTPYRLGASEIRAKINSLAGLAGGITFIDPNGDSHQVTMLTPRRTTAYDLQTRRPHDALQCLLIERRPNESYGSLSQLAGLTLLQMSAYTISQLGEL